MRVRRRLLILVSVYLVLSALLAVGLGEIAFHPYRLPLNRRALAVAGAARFGGELQDVSVRAADGVELQAWFVQPGRNNGNAVILLHGIGDNRQGMMGFAQMFLSQGYAVLVPDSRGHGTSGGGFPSYGVLESDDIRRWFDWLEKKQHPECVFGMGESMGAALVLQAVRTTPFCAVIAESPFATFREISYIRVGQIFHAGQWLGRYALRPSVELAFLYARLTRGVSLTNAAPEEIVERSRVPILLIHGLDDRNIPAEQSELIRAANPGDITLWEVPLAAHCGAVSVEPEEFERRVLGFFADHKRSVPSVRLSQM